MFPDAELGAEFQLDSLAYGLTNDMPISYNSFSCLTLQPHDRIMEQRDSEQESANPTPVSSPSRAHSGYFTNPPEDLFNSDTQLSLIEQSEDLRLDDPAWSMVSEECDESGHESSRKALKASVDDDAYSNMNKDTTQEEELDALNDYSAGAGTTSAFFLTSQDMPVFSFATTNSLNSNILSRWVLSVFVQGVQLEYSQSGHFDVFFLSLYLTSRDILRCGPGIISWWTVTCY